MKTPLKIATLATALAVGLFATTLQAQQEPPPPPPPGEGHGCGRNPQEHFLTLLIEKLSLTEEQQTKVIAILADEKAAMDALRTNEQTTNHEAIHKQIGIIFTSHRAQIRAVLTTEQQKLFDQLKPVRRGPPPPPPAPPGEGAGSE